MKYRIASASVLEAGRLGRRPAKFWHPTGLATKSYDRLRDQDLPLWERIERARAFCVALSRCERSDPEVVRAGRNLAARLEQCDAAWRFFTRYDPIRGEGFHHTDRRREGYYLSGKPQLQYVKSLLAAQGVRGGAEPDGALKVAEKLVRVFEVNAQSSKRQEPPKRSRIQREMDAWTR